MAITFFQNQCVTISYDEELQLGSAVWNGFLSSQEFREAIETCLRMTDEYKPLRWLGDNRKLRAIRQADQDWFVAYVILRLAGSTVRRNASLVSEDLFNQMAVEQIIKRADNIGDMVIRDFDKEEEAMAWLLEPIVAQEQV